jgi:hypothetical protein
LNLRAFLVTNVLLKRRSFHSDYIATDILREMEARIQEDHPVKNLKGMIVHMDSPRAHNSKGPVSETERLEFPRMPHPPDGPDILPCDFWPFGLVKRILKGRKHTSGDELLNSLLAIVKKSHNSRCPMFIANGAGDFTQ